MKSLADQLILNRAATSPEEVRARELLKRPAPNHAAGDPWGMVCDRFVFSPEVILAISETMLSGELAVGDFFDLSTFTRWPAPTFWMELRSKNGKQYGFLKEGSRITHFLYIPGCPPIATCTFDLREGFRECAGYGKYVLPEDRFDDVIRNFSAFAELCFCLADHRITSVRRVLPSFVDRARRAHARRREQLGAPIHSYNVVDLVLPKVAEHRGVLKPVESFAGVRGHLVIGHWRLYDGRPEPYWKWVDGHHRGDDRLGVITKERHVRLAGGTRRGFRLPERSGAPGETIAAEPSS